MNDDFKYFEFNPTINSSVKKATVFAEAVAVGGDSLCGSGGGGGDSACGSDGCGSGGCGRGGFASRCD